VIHGWWKRSQKRNEGGRGRPQRPLYGRQIHFSCQCSWCREAVAEWRKRAEECFKERTGRRLGSDVRWWRTPADD